LRKAGVECIVFEKNASQYCERDWNMGLHWGAPALKSLMPTAWWDQIQSVQVDRHVPTKELDTLKWLQGDTGDNLAEITLGPFYRLRRSKLRGLLSKDLSVQYDKRLVDVAYARDERSVTAYFADGFSATGRMLVGADGARSMTRQLLLEAGLGMVDKLPYAATFVQCKFTDEQALYLRSFHPLYLASAHPHNLFAFFGMHDAADPDDPTSWVFFFYISWQSSMEEQEATKEWTDAQRLAQQKDFAKSFCDPWKSALEWTPDNTPAWYLGLTSWDPGHESHRWNNHGGLITLMGDACHPMTYQRGQGLNHSVTDASQLRDALVKVQEGADHASTISEFEDEMIRRGGTEVREGNANTMMLHDWEKVKQSPLFTKGMKRNDA
jgi:2-polyprenyl-6-methoxyphenol hydroxylase-like FAD-dependent oxidoreductase